MLEIHPGVLAGLVAALGSDAQAGPALAGHVGFDAPLLLAVLRCARLAEPPPQSVPAGLPLADALARLGPDFVRTLVLAARPRPLAQQAAWESGVRVACLARLLAAHTRACDQEQAWLAGLAHNLAEYPAFARASRIEKWLLEADPAGFVLDAVRFCRASPARVRSAHPLVRVLQLAASLVYSVHVNGNVGVRAALGGLGLEVGEVERLQAEADYQAQEAMHRYGVRQAGPADGLTRAYAALARAAALRDFLNLAADREALARRARLVLQGLFDAAPAVLLKVEGSQLVPLPGWPAPPALAALALPADFVQSALSRAAGGATGCWQAEAADQFPVVDAQVARLLGAETLLCEPLGAAVVLVAGNAGAGTAQLPAWMEFLHSLAARLADLESGAGAAPADAIPRHEVRKAVHEASNPLTIIRNYVNLLAAKFAADQDTRRDLAIIGGEIERVAGILQGLGAKREAAAASPAARVDVNQVISELVRMSLDTLFLPNRVNVQIDLDPGLGAILARRDELKQVLLNLAKNAVEAMPQGGRLGFATARGQHRGKDCAVITVQDSGGGLPRQVREQLFQPALSSKGGEHAGLGLYISHNLVAAMGGDIECDSGPGGSAFRIYLPLAEAGGNHAAMQSGSQNQ